MASRAELETRLEQLVEGDGDPAEIAAIIHQIDHLADVQDDKAEYTQSLASTVDSTATVVVDKEDTTMSNISAADLGIEANAQESATTDALSITKEVLGIGGEFSSALSSLSLDTIKSYIVAVQETDDLAVLVMPGKSIIDADHRIHVEQRGEIRRAARGFGIFAAGGVQGGIITSPNGNVHFVENGVCMQKTSSVQLDSFSGKTALIERTSECLGHLDYRNVGTPDNPKWQATGREFSRCQHQWALMFAAGFFISFSKSTYTDVIWVELGQRVGDAAARQAALDKIAEWRDNRQENFETRKTVAQATQHFKNIMGLSEEQLLPAVPEVLTLTLPSGKSVRDAVLALGGARFVVTFEVPMNGKTVEQNIRANSLNELASRVAPIFAAAKLQGKSLAPKSVQAAA